MYIYIIDHYNLLYYYCILPSVNCSNHPLYSNQDSKHLLVLYIFRRIDKGWANKHLTQAKGLVCLRHVTFSWVFLSGTSSKVDISTFRETVSHAFGVAHFWAPTCLDNPQTWPMIVGSQAMVLPFDLGGGWRLDSNSWFWSLQNHRPRNIFEVWFVSDPFSSILVSFKLRTRIIKQPGEDEPWGTWLRAADGETSWGSKKP